MHAVHPVIARTCDRKIAYATRGHARRDCRLLAEVDGRVAWVPYICARCHQLHVGSIEPGERRTKRGRR